MLNHQIRSNPFYQPAAQWQIRLFVPRVQVLAAETVFEDMALALSSFEVEEDSNDWYVDILTETQPDDAFMAEKLAPLADAGNKLPHYEIKKLEAKDWVSEVEQSFPPLNIGRFYVHGSHISDPAPHGKIALKVNAGAAFGSGEHATTSGCLLALGMLAKRRKFRNPLDMGCGSGILAMAMVKLWHVPVTAIDIDPVSTATTRENAHNNRISKLMRTAAGDGYHTKLAKKHARYDLIVANILARPLVRMAPLLKKALLPGGIVVLSGLLANQERMVLAAHRLQGLRLIGRVKRGHWHTLILAN
ncbi:MAG TPA: 50S ribosomal protein L11 methyltransferase [Rickettsiales bacterium]|nr:50S ribosomal protein L11 methyltransferase [Rickettsiales bacterium]